MKKVILLIEDNLLIRESTAELLRLDDYEVLEAASGESALEVLETLHPDLIICDIVMYSMDGYQVYEHLRQNRERIPFIFSSAKAEKQDRQKAKDLGVKHYLTKPYDEDELLQCISESLTG